jgi:alkanesulfonate monooxygenase SsuD/methylene tetrahydromethanopterin reductase-like flavin-dependent oxidoreductase (luciferase family)
MQPLTFGLKASQQHVSIDALREVWAIAEDGGFDGCWLFDHFAPMGRERSGDIFEAWTTLAAMAQATRRVRVGTLVTGNAYRHPGMLAKMAVTVDHISGGRLDLGLGAGGDTYVEAMLGLPQLAARERVERLDEACQVLVSLWTKPSATLAGTYYQLADAVADPKPVQQPHPPLWLASNGERRGLRVVAQRADVWVTSQSPTADPTDPDIATVERLSHVLDQHCEAVGRDPATLRRAVQFRLPDSADDALRVVELHARAGFTDLILMRYGAAESAAAAAEAIAALLPKLRAVG